MKSKEILIILSLVTLMLPNLPAGAMGEDKIVVLTGTSPEFGGGDFVELRYGNYSVGVVYGSGELSNHVIIYSKGRNSMKEIEEKDAGRIIKKEVLDTETLIYEDISRIIEFRDVNNNSRFDAIIDGNGNYTLTSLDYPLRGVEIERVLKNGPVVKRPDDNTAYIELTLLLLKPKVNLAWNDVRGIMRRVSGSVIASSISISLNLTMKVGKERVEMPKYTNSGKEDGIVHEDGEYVETSAEYSINISGWNFKYGDSKIFIEKKRGFLGSSEDMDMKTGTPYVNISTSSPKYMEFRGNGTHPLPRPAYGHMLRIHLGDRKVGQMLGDRVAVVNGNNTTYILMVSGEFPDNLSSTEYTGFSLETTETYIQGNISCGETISLRYLSVEEFQRVSATPSWSYYLPFEVVAMTFFTLFMVKRRSNSQ